MKSTQLVLRTFAVSLLLTGAFAQAATVTGTVTDKTTGKPAAGDTVVLVDVQAGMGEVAHATTDARGHYSLNEPGSSPYLVRVTHQGAGYFIAAPQGGAPGDIPVYDVAAKVQGVFIEADVLEVETENGQLKVDERYFVHNTSSPPPTQWSKRSFEIVLPEDAVLNDAGAQRPGGLPTSIKLDPDGPKGHYSFNFPIQPDDGDKDTLFQISYSLPYSSGKYDFQVHGFSSGGQHRCADAQEHDPHRGFGSNLQVCAGRPRHSDLPAQERGSRQGRRVHSLRFRIDPARSPGCRGRPAS